MFDGNWMSGSRGIFAIITGVIMFALGLFVAARPLWTHNGVLTGTRWLDLAFAVVFMLRGVINVRTGLTRHRAASARV